MTEPEPGQTTAADLVQSNHRFDLREAFLLRQEQLLATLGLGRSVGSHPLAIGDDSELNWGGMIESILPTRYRVSKGFAIDVTGKRSEQIDLLIYDRHFSPVLLDVGSYLFVPAEAVFAALEVKQEINRDTVKYASEKVASVRRLERTSAPVRHISGKAEPKDPDPIIGGLLAMDSSWKPPLGESLKRALKDFGGNGSLDLGCALRAGSFIVNGGAIARSAMDDALIFFIIHLLRRLQWMASPPAIDYDRYVHVLESPENSIEA